jgi:hypothetical protein
MSVIRGGRGPSKAEQEAAKRQADDAEQVRREQLRRDLQRLMALPEFQRWYQHLMAKCNTFGLTETLQVNVDMRAQARRGIGLEICTELVDADRNAATTLFALTFADVLTPSPELPE